MIGIRKYVGDGVLNYRNTFVTIGYLFYSVRLHYRQYQNIFQQVLTTLAKLMEARV